MRTIQAVCAYLIMIVVPISSAGFTYGQTVQLSESATQAVNGTLGAVLYQNGDTLKVFTSVTCDASYSYTGSGAPPSVYFNAKVKLKNLNTGAIIATGTAGMYVAHNQVEELDVSVELPVSLPFGTSVGAVIEAFIDYSTTPAASNDGSVYFTDGC